MTKKTARQIATECECDINSVYDAIKCERILPSGIYRGKNTYNAYQEDLIHNVLYFIGKITEITLESKMNIKETFGEFKERTYTRIKN